MLDQDRYINAPDYAKGEMYLGALARYKVAARDALLAENDHLRTKVFANTAEANKHLFEQNPTPAAYPDKSPDLFEELSGETPTVRAFEQENKVVYHEVGGFEPGKRPGEEGKGKK